MTRTLREALSRIDGGTELARQARALGLWTTDAHRNIEPRRPFKTELGNLTPLQLSNESGWWAAEGARIIEMLGLLNALAVALKHDYEVVKAQARVTARKTWLQTPVEERTKTLTKPEIEDLVTLDPGVSEVQQQLLVVEQLLAVVTAARDATQNYKETISREITLKTTQMTTGLYG
ncbi:MAG: hypothetical protein WDA77_12115 [Acidimicrobiia bacterium]